MRVELGGGVTVAATRVAKPRSIAMGRVMLDSHPAFARLIGSLRPARASGESIGFRTRDPDRRAGAPGSAR